MKHLKHTLFVLFLTFSLLYGFAQSTFDRTYEMATTDFFDPSDIIPYSQKYYAIASGQREYLGSGRFREYNGLISTDEHGNLVWAKKYTLGSYHHVDDGYDLNFRVGPEIVNRHDGKGFVMATNTEAIMSTDIKGNPIWTYNYADKNIGNPRWKKIVASSDGNYVVMGTGYLRNIYPPEFPVVMKINKLGKVIWTRKMTLPIHRRSITPHQMIQDPNGDLYVLSISLPTKYILWKLDKNGNTDWVKSYDVSPFSDMIRGIPGIIHANNQEFLIAAGATAYFSPGHPFREEEFLQIKLNSNGDFMWSRIDQIDVPTFSGYYEYDIKDIIEDKNGGFSLIDWGSDFDYFWEEGSGTVIRIDAQGVPLHAARHGFPFYGATRTRDGQLGIIGVLLKNSFRSTAPIHFLKTDLDGFTGCNDSLEAFRFVDAGHVWQKPEFPTISSKNPKPIKFIPKVEKFVKEGEILCKNGEILSSKRESVVNSPEAQEFQDLPILYPNPSQGAAILDLKDFQPSNSVNPIKLEMFDPMGKLIREEELQSGTTQYKLNFEQSGIYLIRLHAEERIWTKKIVVNK